MKYNVIKKGLVLCIISLFFGITIVWSEPSKIIQNPKDIAFIQSNTWIVDDDGDGNFTQIQEAIDNESVQDYDTILVYNGTYQGNIQITKKLKIEGMKTEYPPDNNPIAEPFINGDTFDDVVQIKISEVIFSGFKLEGGLFEGIQISDNKDNVIISNNTLISCGTRGIFIYEGSNNNIISGNTILNSQDHGIRLDHSNNNTISDNMIIGHNYSGIYLEYYCRNNNIYNNKIMDCHIALYIEGYSHYNNIYWNNITNCDVGIHMEVSDYNIISQNSFENCSIFLSECNKIQIYYNNFFNVKGFSNLGFFYDSDIKWQSNYWDKPRIVKFVWGTWKVLTKDRKLPAIEFPSAPKPFKIPA
jgi:parallel beta-helix repeat protein